MDVNIQLDSGGVTGGADEALRTLEKIRKLVASMEPVTSRLAASSRADFSPLLASLRDLVSEASVTSKKLQIALATGTKEAATAMRTDLASAVRAVSAEFDKLKQVSLDGSGASKIRGSIAGIQRGMNELKTSTQEAASATVQSFESVNRSLESAGIRIQKIRGTFTEPLRQLGAEARSTAADMSTLTAASTRAAAAAGKVFTGTQILSTRKKFQSSLDSGALFGLTPAGSNGASAVSLAEVNAAVTAAQGFRTLSTAMTGTAASSAALTVQSGLLTNAFGAQIATGNNLHSLYRGLASGFGAMWLTWGNAIPILAGAGVSHAITSAIKMGADLDNTLTAIGAVGEVAASDVEKLNQALLDTGRASTYGPREAAEAMKALAYAGLTATQQMQALPTVLDFAKVGGQDLKSAAETLVAVGNAYGYQAGQLSLVSDIIAKTAASSMADVADMSQAFRQASTVAQQYGVSLQDTATGLALLSQAGIRGSAAGTAFRQMYNELIGTSKKAREALDKLGVSIFDNVNNRMRPLADIVGDLTNKLQGMSFEGIIRTLQQLGNERGMKSLSATMQAIAIDANNLGEDVPNSFRRMQEAISDSAGFTQRAASQMAESTRGLMDKVGAALETSLIDAFQQAKPEIDDFFRFLHDAFASKDLSKAVGELLSTVMVIAKGFAEMVVAVAPVAPILGTAAVAVVALNTVLRALTVVSAAAGEATAVFSASQAASTAAMAATGRAATVTGGLVTAAGAAARGASAGFVILQGSMLPLIGAILAVYAAYLLLKSAMAGNATDKAAAGIEGEKDRLAKERDRLLEETRLIKQGRDAAQASALVEQNQKLKAYADANAEDIAKQEKTVADLQSLQDKATNATRKAQLQRKIDAAQGRITDLKQQEADTRASLSAMNDDLALAQRANAKAKQEQVDRNVAVARASLGTLGGSPGIDTSKASHTKVPEDDELRRLEKYQAMLKSAQDDAIVLQNSTGPVDKMTQAEKDLVLERMRLNSVTDAAGRAFTAKEKAVQRDIVATLEAVVAEESRNKAMRDSAEAAKKISDNTDKLVESLKQENEGLQEQVDHFGKSKVAIEQARLARMESAAADGQAVQIGKQLVNVTEEMLRQERDKIANLQALNFLGAQSKLTEEIAVAKESLATAQDELRYMGMSNLERQKAIALRKVELDYEKDLRSISRQRQLGDIDAIQEAVLKKEAADKKAIAGAAEVSKIIAADYVKTADTINNALTDALANSFESGKGFAKNLANALKSLFNQLVLRPVISFIVSPISNMLSGAVSSVLGTGGTGSGGGSGLLGTASNANSLFSSGSLVANWMGTGTGAGMGTLAFGNAVGALGGDGLGAFIAANGGWGTSGVGALGSSLGGVGGSALTGLGVVALPLIVGALVEKYGNNNQRMTGAATSANTAAPSVVSGAIDYNALTGDLPDHDALVKQLTDLGINAGDLNGLNDRQLRRLYNSVVGSQDAYGSLDGRSPGEFITSDFIRKWSSGNDGANGTMLDYYRGQGYANPEALGWWSNDYYSGKDSAQYGIDPALVQFSRSLALGVADPYNTISKALGGAGGYTATAGLAYDPDHNKGWWAGLNISDASGASAVDFGKREGAGTGKTYDSQDEAMQALFKSAYEGLKQLDLPDWAKKQVDDTTAQFDALTGDNIGQQAATLYQTASASIANTIVSIDRLIKVFPDFSSATQDSVYAVSQAIGGMDSLNSAYSSFVQNFYTGSERQKLASDDLQKQFKDLGVTMPKTREEFRKMVSAALDAKDGNADLAAALLKMGDAVASVLPAVAEFADGDKLKSLIVSGFLGTYEGTSLGQDLANVVVDGVYNAIVGSFSQQISDIVVQGVVNPVIQAAVTGTSLTAAVSATTIDTMVKQAGAVADALVLLFDNPDFKNAMDRIGKAVSGLTIPTLSLSTSYGTASVATSSYTSAVDSSAAAAESAAEKIQSAWQDIADSLIEQVNKIRGVIADDSPNSLAYWQAQFAINTAAARAGDQDAAGKLVSLSDSLLEAASTQAGSLLELQRIRAATAQSLQDTAGYATAFAGGASTSSASLTTLSGGSLLTPVDTTQPIVISADPGLIAAITHLEERMDANDRVMADLVLQQVRMMREWTNEGLLVTQDAP